MDDESGKNDNIELTRA